MPLGVPAQQNQNYPTLAMLTDSEIRKTHPKDSAFKRSSVWPGHSHIHVFARRRRARRASPAADASPSMVSLRPCRTFRGPAFDRVDATLSRVDNTPDLTLPDLVRRRTSSATSSSPNALQGGPEGVRRFAPNNPLRHPCRKV